MLVRAFGPDDVDLAVRLSFREGWNLSADDLRTLLKLDPRGCLIAEVEGRPVGLVTTVAYGKLGWIGLLVVEEASRGQGYGRALLDTAVGRLLDRGVRTVGVDATPQAMPLYSDARFRPAFDIVHLRRAALPAPAPTANSLVPVEPKDLHALTMFDWAYFGGRRRRVLADLLQRSSVGYLAQDVTGTGGYLLARQGSQQWVIGPWVCVRAAESLLTQALSAIGPQPVALAVPEVNRHAMDLVRKYHFEPCSRRVRMYYGDEEGVGQPQHIYAIASVNKG